MYVYGCFGPELALRSPRGLKPHENENDLFPDGRGDITKPRLGKKPSKREYFKHLLNVNRSFARHHSFLFVASTCFFVQFES